MGFSNWSESNPRGQVTRASSVDEELRSAKSQIGERMRDVSNWPGDEAAGRLFLKTGTARIGVGLADERPSPEGEDGQVYFNTDTSKLDVTKGGEWLEEPASVSEIHAKYDPSLAAGSRVTLEEAPDRILVVDIPTAKADADGNFFLQLGEFDGGFQAGKLVSVMFSINQTFIEAFWGVSEINNYVYFTFVWGGSGDGAGRPFPNATVWLTVRMTFKK